MKKTSLSSSCVYNDIKNFLSRDFQVPMNFLLTFLALTKADQQSKWLDYTYDLEISAMG